MRCIGGQEEHLPLTNDDVLELALVDDLQGHGAFVLEEPLGGLVEVVIGAGIWTSHDLERVR